MLTGAVQGSCNGSSQLQWWQRARPHQAGTRLGSMELALALTSCADCQAGRQGQGKGNAGHLRRGGQPG